MLSWQLKSISIFEYEAKRNYILIDYTFVAFHAPGIFWWLAVIQYIVMSAAPAAHRVIDNDTIVCYSFGMRAYILVATRGKPMPDCICILWNCGSTENKNEQMNLNMHPIEIYWNIFGAPFYCIFRIKFRSHGFGLCLARCRFQHIFVLLLLPSKRCCRSATFIASQCCSVVAFSVLSFASYVLLLLLLRFG